MTRDMARLPGRLRLLLLVGLVGLFAVACGEDEATDDTDGLDGLGTETPAAGTDETPLPTVTTMPTETVSPTTTPAEDGADTDDLDGDTTEGADAGGDTTADGDPDLENIRQLFEQNMPDLDVSQITGVDLSDDGTLTLQTEWDATSTAEAEDLCDQALAMQLDVVLNGIVIEGTDGTTLAECA